MDRAEEILTALQQIATTAGYTVERDRVYPISGADMPLAVLRTGEEESVPLDNAPAHSWASRWEMRPTIEVWLHDVDPDALSAAGRSAFNAVREATVAHPTLLELLAHGQPPRMSVNFERIDDAPDVLAVEIGFELTFER